MKARATAIAVSVVALADAAAVHAAEYEIQLKGCATNDAAVLDKVSDTVIGTNDTRGTVEATFTEPINGRATRHCRVVWTASKEGAELVNPGTGKLAGIQGSAGQPQGTAVAARRRCPAVPTSVPVAYEPERSGRPVSSGSPPRRDRRRFG